ncbi:MAG: PKD domain-containing protein [Cyclobacteriaceae bacterium]|nr:PKD domain-containing protein [Cyclobacteriaceae bacterium]
MRTLFFFLSFSFVTLTGFSQNLERYNWYFGSSNQAIRFNRTSAIPGLTTKSLPFGAGGSATASDPANANMLFYTDGQFVYDFNNGQMPAGFGLLGNTAANQPVAICPVPGPGNEKKYFIFTNTANFTAGGSISVSVVDMGLFGNSFFPAPASGDLESKNALIGLTGRSEGMTIIPHTNGTDFWLITQPVNSGSFSRTLINAASYTGVFNTTTVTGVSAVSITAANLSYHAGKKKIAVSPQDTNTDAIIINFDPATGSFTFDRTILNSGVPTTTNQSIYDIEWSATGDFIYISRFGETGVQADLLQFDFLNPGTTLTTVLPTPVFRSYGVQIAPDSSIYHLYQATSGGPFLLGNISKPDTIATEVRYLTSQLSATNFAGTQFSSFAPRLKVNLVVDFNFIGTCQNNNTNFFPIIQPAADSLHWDFGDMTAISNDWSPVHRYTAAQAFSATLTAYYQGDSLATTKPVTITAFPIQLTLVQDTTACGCQLPFPKVTSPRNPKIKTSCPEQPTFSVKVSATGGTPTSYVWSNGDTGPILTPDSAGYYYVIVSDASGCSTYAGVNVKEYDVMDQRANIWYFGANAGIDFNEMPPVPLTNSAMNAPEGCAIICDRNGKTIFYTDGNDVFDKNDALIDSGIGGDPQASQSSIIIPVEGDETLFYIFTNEAVNGTSANTVKYSLFDLKKNSGLGAIVIKNQTLFSKSTERIASDGRWLVIHEYGNNTFRSYRISANGIGDPVLTAIGSDHSFSSPNSGMGYMKFGPAPKLAVALSTGTANLIELFDFVDSTGKVVNYRKIDLKQSTGQVYGIEFSPGGNKIFATVKGAPTPFDFFEYFIDSIGVPYFRQKLPATQELGAIQIAPDGQIYIAINNSPFLGTITAREDTTAVSTIDITSGFSLAGKMSNLGLPNFIQQISSAFGGPSIEAVGFCLGSPTQFTGNGTDAIDMYAWVFDDGGTSDQAAVEHTYATAKTYNVTLQITNRCGYDTLLVRPTTIFTPPAPPTIPLAAALCPSPVVLDANTGNIAGLTYFWTDGTTNQTLVVTRQSIVGVTLTDTHGCTSEGQTFVVLPITGVELGPPITVCQDSLVPPLDAGNAGLNFAWTINGAPQPSGQTQIVDTSAPGVFLYRVTVSDPLNGCSITDEVTITVNPTPPFNFTGSNPLSCGADGSVTLTLLTPPAGLYSYFIAGPGPFAPIPRQNDFDQTVAQSPYVFIVKAGTYSATVQDQVSGCSATQTIGLSDATWTASAVASPCDPSSVTVNIASGAPVLPLVYTYRSPTRPQVGPFTAVNTASLPSGDWVVEVRDANGTGCIFTFDLVIPPVTSSVSITPGLCTTPPTLTAVPTPGASAFSWTGPGIVGPANGATININASGTYQVNATIGGCPNLQSIVVTLDNPTPDFTQSDPCRNSITVTAIPNGNYTYHWYKAGVLQPGLVGRVITLGLGENGASYQVEVVSGATGCTFMSAPKVVQINGTIAVIINPAVVCDDNQPFTLVSSGAPAGVTYKWYRNNVVIVGEVSASITLTAVGTYKVEVTRGTCSAFSEPLTVGRAPLPIGNLPNRLIICNDPENRDPLTNQVDLDPGVFKSYNWFKNDLTLNYTSQILNVTSQGTYKVDITSLNNCVASDQTEVLNECLPKIDAPNAFRPSSTLSENKEFYVFSFFIKDTDFQVFLYNRWGELVYTSSDRYFRWNGGYNGLLNQPVPGGSYAYIIRYVSAFHPERGVQEKRGGVAVLR